MFDPSMAGAKSQAASTATAAKAAKTFYSYQRADGSYTQPKFPLNPTTQVVKVPVGGPNNLTTQLSTSTPAPVTATPGVSS